MTTSSCTAPARLSAGSVRSLRATTGWRWPPRWRRWRPARATSTTFDCIATSYPGFLDDLVALGGSVVVPRIWVGTPAPPVPRAVPAGGIIAIDGPAGSGKSTVSRTLAKRLGIQRLDTGAMYRAIAWAALDRGIDPADAEAVAASPATRRSTSARRRSGSTAPTSPARSGRRSSAGPSRSSPPTRTSGPRSSSGSADGRSRHGGGVVEGRDIGTVVFPGAALKVYLDASPEERARRRHDEPADGVARRDRIDSTRAASPLYTAADAHVVDTTGRTVDEVIEQILSWL